MKFTKIKEKLTKKNVEAKYIIKELSGNFIIGESKSEDLELWKESILEFYNLNKLSIEEKGEQLLLILNVYNKYLEKHYPQEVSEHKFWLEVTNKSLKIRKEK